MRRKILAAIFVLAVTATSGALAQRMNHAKHLGASAPAGTILLTGGTNLLTGGTNLLTE